MLTNRRTLLALVVSCGAVLLTTPSAQAQGDYPNRPIRIVVGFGPGGADLTARAIGARMSQSLGQQTVVEFRTGAGSSLAAELVARSPKDGYTLLLATIAQPINAAVNPNLSFDFAKDFAPIIHIATTPSLLVINSSVPARTVKDLIAYAKANPNKLSFGSSGVNTGTHLSGELLGVLAGAKLVHVPYSGIGQAVTDLLAGRIEMMFAPASFVLQHVREGKLIALASTEAKRSASAPDLPTMIESGLTDFEVGLWYGLVAPAGTPREILDKLSRAAMEAVKAEEVVRALAAIGIEVVGGTPEVFARYIAKEMARWNTVVTAAGLRK